MTAIETNPALSELPDRVSVVVHDLIEHPAQLNAEDFADLCRGRLRRLFGSQPSVCERAILAAVIGRGF